jgi:L-alanine-DL-glutamate epimerase-like enolase superfamily enzyme
MKITRVEATNHVVPVTVPLLSEPVRQRVVFVRVETDEGITGYGVTGGTQRSASTALINREMAPLIVGTSPLETERIWNELFHTLNPRAQTGAWSTAMSAVDIALWDIKGKAFGQPVWRLLGGHSQRVEAYVTFGLLEYSREQLVEVARMLVGLGHDKLKMVVAVDGGRNTAEDATRVRGVREAIGDSVELMVDANYRFDLTHARDLCRRLEPYHLTWFEEPVYGNDARLLAQLRHQTSIPLSAGQNEGHKWRHIELLVHEAVDILQPNVCWVGGYTEGVKVAHMAQAFNVPIANGGGWPHHNMHLMGAVANGWRVEFHYLMWMIGNAIFQDPPQPEAGWVTLPDRPGLGLEPKEDVLRETLER